ncbi:MAG: Nif11-like leader peptide family RiPP precursor [Clostridia bacterium]|nr:Nif11-like leader peptide family RiPP precursor [Clostridia bacterium]
MSTKEKIDALMQDENFVEKFKAAGSPEEITALYKQQGIEITEENAKASYDYMHGTGELDESALEKVSGGSMRGVIGIATAATAASIAVGILAAGAVASNIGNAINNVAYIKGQAAVEIANTIRKDAGV